MDTATLDRKASDVLAAVAAAYRDCRTALDGLRQPWSDLRDPAKPWQQTMLLLHDQHQVLARAARVVENSLYAACDLYADQRALGYHLRDRSLIENLERHPDLTDGLYAVDLHPDEIYPFSLVEFAPHHIVANYP